MSSSNYEKIYAVVRQIPCGTLATYGQIARLAGLPGHARQVGYALHALPEDSDVPWHRIINSKGQISIRSDGHGEDRQFLCLKEEGVLPAESGRYALSEYQWNPDALLEKTDNIRGRQAESKRIGIINV